MSQFQLGDMYFKGQGVEKDVNRAKEYWLKAAEQGNDLAKASLEKLNQ